MKTTKNTLLVVICIGFVTICYGQHRRYQIRNGVGVQGGITQNNILTDNFETQASSGFTGGLTAWVDIPHKWYNVSYNISLSESNFDISARSPLNSMAEFVEYKLLMAQLSLLLHAKVLGNNLTFDVGPMLQYGGELELKDDEKEDYIITNYNNLLASDVAEISRFNINGVVGLTAGFGRFAIKAHYVYGFTNILNKLNEQGLDSAPNNSKFKGNQSMLLFTATIFL